ncbi:DUF6747 family protein [Maribacter algarum]|uniref:DUF6747 family protein n=1 Tax=Maribacter algarum (ex Zhang et al. 2020) TaxID=2578118 RepID=UPI0026BA1D6C|nr:DUF6747 family protein [Maribacter algarum]
MKTTLLIKEIYLEGFKNIGSFILKNYFKFFSWFCFALIFMGFYALLFRIFTGFSFN